MSPAPNPLDRLELRARVQHALEEFLARQRPRLQAVGPELEPLYDAVSAFLLDGGKRLRPAFAFWGHLGAGGQDSDALVRAVSALELLQACALVHDDVMDGSDTRRGKPAVHRVFAAHHREHAWSGDPDAFGSSAAILIGDLCLIWADELLNTAGVPADALVAAQPVYDEMRVELMAGQYLDLLEQARGGSTVEGALQVARYKSAKYTIEKPLHLGAVLAGADADHLAALTAYGLPLGEAFQLRDDVLGVFGDPATTGKPAGDDLREGKRTALVAHALAVATPAQETVVRRHLGDPHLSAEGVAALREVLVSTGALQAVEDAIEQRTTASRKALAEAPVTAEAREVLEALAHAATTRAT